MLNYRNIVSVSKNQNFPALCSRVLQADWFIVEITGVIEFKESVTCFVDGKSEWSVCDRSMDIKYVRNVTTVTIMTLTENRSIWSEQGVRMRLIGLCLLSFLTPWSECVYLLVCTFY